MEVAHYSSVRRRIYPDQRQLNSGDSSADQDRLSYMSIVVHLPTHRHSSSLDLLALIADSLSKLAMTVTNSNTQPVTLLYTAIDGGTT